MSRCIFTTALSTTALLTIVGATQATAGTITLETAAIAADLDNQRGSGAIEDQIGTGSAFTAEDFIGDGITQADLVFGTSTRFAEASIDARVPFGGVLDVSGTSRNTDAGGETFHLVELNVSLDAGESFLATAHDFGDTTNDFDRVFLSSVQLFDADGVAVDFDPIFNDGDSPSLSFAPGAGDFLAVFSASSPSPAGDDEFRVRFSTVTGAPSPTAAAAGLLGLIGLAGRRRRKA